MCLIHKFFFKIFPEGFIKFCLLLKTNYTQALQTHTHTLVRNIIFPFKQD